MKRFLFLLSLLIIAFIPFNVYTVQAEGPYLRVIDEQTPFYANPFSATPLFYLPYTYYVKVIDVEDDFYHVEYCGENGVNGIDGFVPKDLLYDDDLTAQYHYPSLTITTSSNAVLYENCDLDGAIQYIFPNRQVKFYGQSTSISGERLYYVSYNDKLGYIKESALLPFEVPLHPNPLTFLEPPVIETPPEETPPTETPSNDTVSLRIAIIVCLAFAGIFGLFIAFKNKSSKVNPSYFEERDYE